MENMFFKPLGSTQPRENESTSTSVAPCVPNHNFLMQTMTSKIGLRARRPTSMIFIAAFDYSNYSVITTEVIGWYGKAIYCRYLDENRQELGDVIPSTVFPESVVYCCSREGAVHMTLTEKSDDPINEVVRITDRRNDDPRYFLSFCLAPIFGKERKWLLLAELFEHYKLQGVEHFYIYIKEVDNYTKKLLDYYVTIGEIEIVTFTSKEIKDVIDTQLVGVAECLHRSRHHSRYAFFADLDERVLTTHGHTFSSFVRNTMAKASNSAALRFTSRLVFRTSPMPKVYQGEKTLKEHLPMAVFRNSSSIFAGRMTKKCVLDPKRVLIHYIHTSRAYYPGYEINDVPFKKIHIRDGARAKKRYIQNENKNTFFGLRATLEHVMKAEELNLISENSENENKSHTNYSAQQIRCIRIVITSGGHNINDCPTFTVETGISLNSKGICLRWDVSGIRVHSHIPN
ncbi:hypothetical protein NECAME_12376 [Necator americanus]|uniref:Glycosyltransferase family 92 protein n=1 Tax=Necator americanus TaxID=51031 RepID=W2T0B5_NECAM|nr:hypothetical protein NECAME_12376 [Necator americanus]ETN75450.1 hypothetical protein NECAME_12376 [Necator americanus]